MIGPPPYVKALEASGYSVIAAFPCNRGASLPAGGVMITALNKGSPHGVVLP
jgi:hypothetical protein